MGEKVVHLTYSEAFPKESNWTHVAGVHHIVCRNDQGFFFIIMLQSSIKQNFYDLFIYFLNIFR